MTYPSALTAELLDVDGVTVVSGALNYALPPRFMDELDGCGTGEISIGFYDADVDNMDAGMFVRVYTNSIPAFTFQIEGKPAYGQIKKGGKIEEIITASGRGHMSIFEKGITAPEPLLVGVNLDTSFRHWTFASINFPNAGSWTAAVEHYEYKDGITVGLRIDSEIDPGPDPDTAADDVVKLYPAPMGFPWPNAPKNGNGFAPTPTYDPVYWVIAGNTPSLDPETIGFHFFRGGFSLAGTQSVVFHGTGDNFYKYFLDGVPIFEEQDDTVAWKQYKDVTLTLPAGFHTIGYVVENIPWEAGLANPGGALFDAIAVSIYPGDTETTLTLSLLTSGATDLVESFFSPDTWPGWTPGQILDDWTAEVMARGAIYPFGTGTYTGTLDSNGDAWASANADIVGPYVPTFSQKIFNTGLDLLNDLTSGGWIHWHGQPDSFDLDAWGGASAVGVDSGAVFSEANGNIRALERGQSKPYANSLLVQYANGYVWATDTAEVTAHGSTVEAGFTSDAVSEADAVLDGLTEIQQRKSTSNEAILIEIEPRDATEAPYEGFTVGDYITIPDKHDDPILQQVLSIVPDADDDGNAFWRLEVNARWRSPEKEAEDLLRKVGGATYGSVGDRGVPRL